MATYNGEKYIGEQIDSILNQTNRDWTLYIQDDGSTDSTVGIIHSYKDERIILVDVGLSHQGACMNFMSLLNMIESDYYMFCDQDDVWLPNKIELSYSRVKEIEIEKAVNIPILVHTDKKRVDENLNILLESELNRKNDSSSKMEKLMKERNSLEQLRLGTFIAGCVMCFNHRAKEVAFPFNNSRMQDSIIAMAVAKNQGVISTIYEPTMLYRIHSTNTCGVSETSIMTKIKHLVHTINGNTRIFYLYKIYGGGEFV